MKDVKEISEAIGRGHWDYWVDASTDTVSDVMQNRFVYISAIFFDWKQPLDDGSVVVLGVNGRVAVCNK